MTQFNAPAYDIQRPTGRCAFTGRELVVGESYIATLLDLPPDAVDPTAPPAAPNSTTPAASIAGGFRRLDVSLEAWQQGKRPEHLFGFWRSVVQPPNQKRKIFVDDQVLLELFMRLSDTDQPQRLAFRFVLALILMRKKLLKYEGQEMKNNAEGKEQEWWKLTPKGQTEPMIVLNPGLDEASIQQVTEQLGQILEAEL